MVEDSTILDAIAGNLVRDLDGAIYVDKKAPPLLATFDLLVLSCNSGSGRGKLKRASQKWKELFVPKGASWNANWSAVLKQQP